MSYVSRYELRLAYEDCIRRKHNTDNAVNMKGKSVEIEYSGTIGKDNFKFEVKKCIK